MSGYVRQTIGLQRNLEGLKAKARARTRRQREAVLKATLENLEEELDLWLLFCPRDTNYMAEHIHHQLTRGGFNYFLAFLRTDFVGQVNPATQKLITEFYPFFQIRGTRFITGNDFPREARRLMRPRARERYRRALAVR